ADQYGTDQFLKDAERIRNEACACAEHACFVEANEKYGALAAKYKHLGEYLTPKQLQQLRKFALEISDTCSDRIYTRSLGEIRIINRCSINETNNLSQVVFTALIPYTSVKPDAKPTVWGFWDMWCSIYPDGHAKCSGIHFQLPEATTHVMGMAAWFVISSED